MILRLVVAVSLTIFFVVILIRNSRRKSVKRNLSLKNGREFEDFLCELFNKAGYKAHRTKFSHDFGADLLVENRGKLVVLQAKYYNRPIDTDAIEQAIVAGTIYGTAYVGVITNNEIPDRVKEFAKQFEDKTFVKKIYLIDGKILEKLKRGERII